MTIPKQLIVGATITQGPQAWQVLQREADGRAEITLQGTWAGDGITGVQTRVVNEYDGSAVAGCDWEAAGVTGDHAWRAERRVPTGGPYQVQARGIIPPPGRVAASTICTLAPGRSLTWPSVTTTSSAATPLSRMASAPITFLSDTGRTSTVLSALTT